MLAGGNAPGAEAEKEKAGLVDVNEPTQQPGPPLPTQLLGTLSLVKQADLDPVVRASIAFLVIGAMLWMEWFFPTAAPPEALLSAAGLVTGYYLTGDAPHVMKGLLSLTYVAIFAAFFVVKQMSAPDFVVNQVTTVIGIWYGQRQQVRKMAELTAAVVEAKNGK